MMITNDVLRRIRYTFEFNDSKMVELFNLSGTEVTRAQISSWLKKDDDPAFVEMEEVKLSSFLNGLIVDKRGKKDGETPEPEKRLTNNIVFRKIRIALNLKDDEILSIIKLGGMTISKHELSALFRNPNQVQYRVCNDQLLRYFLKGLQIEYRDIKPHMAQ